MGESKIIIDENNIKKIPLFELTPAKMEYLINLKNRYYELLIKYKKEELLPSEEKEIKIVLENIDSYTDFKELKNVLQNLSENEIIYCPDLYYDYFIGYSSLDVLLDVPFECLKYLKNLLNPIIISLIYWSFKDDPKYKKIIEEMIKEYDGLITFNETVDLEKKEFIRQYIFLDYYRDFYDMNDVKKLMRQYERIM